MHYDTTGRERRFGMKRQIDCVVLPSRKREESFYLKETSKRVFQEFEQRSSFA